MKTLIKFRYILIVIVFSNFYLNTKAQEIVNNQVNQIIVDPTLNVEILYGYCTSEALARMSIFSQYYEESIMNYTIDTSITSQINITKNMSITIVFGSWCSDSHREVPRFLQIMNLLNVSEDQITIIAVNRMKEFNKIDLREMDIKLVPTFIIYRDGKELGRIVERAEIMELELLKIVN